MSIIRIGGFRWSADKVGWGVRGRSQWEMLADVKPPQARNASKEGCTVNIWLVQAVYALYRGDILIYVGEGTLGNRLLNHRTDWLAGKWDTFSWLSPWEIDMSRRPYTLKKWSKRNPIRLDAKHLIQLLETVLINLAEPPLNSKMPAMAQHIMWLSQSRSKYSGLSLDEKLDRILNHLEKGSK